LARHRSIDREAVLDAAERVIIRDGAANLTLEAVAVEAGICKASVLYDYKTKRALIRKLIERRSAIEEAVVRDLVSAEDGRQNAHIRGHVAAATRSFSDEERAVGLNLCAALAQDADLREPVQHFIRTAIVDIASSSTYPRGAALAFLATQGLVLLDWFGLHSFPPEDRARLVADIGWLIEQTPTPREG
jgi:AcrR family transcriptional regulator